ncbi:MAG: hypothetical protein DI598_16415 [Pseudopedobacter saltans]|uniref:Uncharacterized protein n=1 Tax=Pseudopedobacter saltans TaxID=151895 RepID=A0A2W5EJY1_9SPHI|nr:MAG: hypothetical protein DI598_16415 [Pseudopedobacter saltans]
MIVRGNLPVSKGIESRIYTNRITVNGQYRTTYSGSQSRTPILFFLQLKTMKRRNKTTIIHSMTSRNNKMKKTRKKKKFVPLQKNRGGTKNTKGSSRILMWSLIALGVIVFIALFILSVILSGINISKGHLH